MSRNCIHSEARRTRELIIRADIATKDDVRYAPVGNIIENRPKMIFVLFGLVVVAHFVASYCATHDQFLPEMGVGEVSDNFPCHGGSRDQDLTRGTYRAEPV